MSEGKRVGERGRGCLVQKELSKHAANIFSFFSLSCATRFVVFIERGGGEETSISFDSPMSFGNSPYGDSPLSLLLNRINFHLTLYSKMKYRLHFVKNFLSQERERERVTET
jgi:hypothetical protein